MKYKFIKKIILGVFILFLSINTPTFANEEVSKVVNTWFTSFSKKISKKYNGQEEIQYFKNLIKKINTLQTKHKFNDKQIKIINDLITLSNEYIFKKTFYYKNKKNKEIINNNSLVKNYKYKSFNSDNIFIKDGVWYAYIYDTTLYFDVDNKDLNERSLTANKIYTNSSLVFIRDNGRFGFANDFKIKRLINDKILFGISGKYNFLRELKDDKKTLNYNTDEIFEKLKNESKKLTDGKTNEEKIKIIYNYILSNIEYTKEFSLDDAEIFSGIFTYINKNGVCEGYVKLFLYMLNFSNIDDVEVIRGYVLDANDFPNIGHAWNKIGDKYYDPTFDDPIGRIDTKIYDDYKYFGLPYDLFYTNRYTFEKIPKFLKTKSLEYRKHFIDKRVIKLLNKYRNSGYNLLKPYLLKEKYNIDFNKRIDIEDLKKIVPYYEVDNWKINVDGKIKTISNLKFYNVENSNIEDLLEQLKYKLEGYYLLYMKNDNGKFEYRLAYDLKFR